jgi:hypothetical protein
MSPTLQLPQLEGVTDANGQRLWPPPEEVKRLHLLTLFADGGHEVFIESGTYLGGTVRAFAPHARRIFSIELAPQLYADAAAAFAGMPHVSIIEGDATEHVPRLVADLDKPPLIFLDGHYSCGETACGDEAEPAVTIIGLLGESGVPAGTTIVVDDLRTFDGLSVPITIDDLVTACRAAFPDCRLHCHVDALVVHV